MLTEALKVLIDRLANMPRESMPRELEKSEFAVSAVQWFTVARYGSARAVAAIQGAVNVSALTLRR